MADVHARHGPLGPILMPSTSHEEWAQQMIIPPTSAVKNLLLPPSGPRSMAPILLSATTSGKGSSVMESKSSKKLNKTMLDSKVKKSGKAQAQVEASRYIALIAQNGIIISCFAFYCLVSN
jgi:hypothetical protein